MKRNHYDAIIIGARCAGAATALLLARKGAKVLLVDRGLRGSDTMSTHALMRGGMASLQRWGLYGAIAASGAPAVRSTAFYYDGVGMRMEMRARAGIDALYAPRRTVLDRMLGDAAQEAGVELRHATVMSELERRGDRVNGAVLFSRGRRLKISADIVIGADGIRSSVAEEVGARVTHRAEHATACLYGYVPGLPGQGYEWAFAPGAASGAIPTHDGEHCVFVSFPQDQRHAVLADGAEAAFARELEKTMPWMAGEARNVGRIRQFHGVKGYLRQAVGQGWALVGDAGYFKDPMTAHGITDAFRDAELLARALGIGSQQALEDYVAIRNALSLPLMRVTDRIAAFDWTMPELETLHRDLNRVMNQEIAEMAALVGPDTRLKAA